MLLCGREAPCANPGVSVRRLKDRVKLRLSVHEILGQLPPGSLVLDLGCAGGSFSDSSTAGSIVRFDREARAAPGAGAVVRGDARSLPFPDATFRAIVSNHSLEHFDDLPACLREIGRVIRTDGALYAAVPDSSTITDRLYRWLARGGGHVNSFTSADDLAHAIEEAVGLRHVASRTLCSSLSFLDRHNTGGRSPRRLIFLGAGYEWSLFLYVWLSRGLDRWLKTRTSIYGWALYFGNVPESLDTSTWLNVCIRCGSASPSPILRSRGFVRTVFLRFRLYRCPECGAWNPYFDDGCRHSGTPPVGDCGSGAG